MVKNISVTYLLKYLKVKKNVNQINEEEENFFTTKNLKGSKTANGSTPILKSKCDMRNEIFECVKASNERRKKLNVASNAK